MKITKQAFETIITLTHMLDGVKDDLIKRAEQMDYDIIVLIDYIELIHLSLLERCSSRTEFYEDVTTSLLGLGMVKRALRDLRIHLNTGGLEQDFIDMMVAEYHKDCNEIGLIPRI